MMVVDRSAGCVNAKSLYFKCSEHGHPFELKTGCHSRFECQCPVCSKKWNGLNRKKFAEAIAGMARPRFLTLTLTKRRAIRDNLDRIWDCRRALFRKLRAQGFKIHAWIGVVELPNHIHMVIDSDYIPQRDISKVWKTVTGDSYIVDIRQVKVDRHRAARGAVAYISKYLTKALGWAGSAPGELKGFHVVQTNGVPALPKRTMKCPCCGSVVGVVHISLEEFVNTPEYEPPAS